MANFLNTISWSISRANTFEYCKRKYYLAYYESWNGWNYYEQPRKQLVYFLKKRESADIWIGNVVHNAIKYIIQNSFKVTREYILVNLQKRILRDYNESNLRTRQNSKPKDFWLYEHYKNLQVNIEDHLFKAESSLNNFFNSEFFDEIKQAKLIGEILYLDDGDINKSLFVMNGIPIYAIPDLSYRKSDGTYVIIDWKTGRNRDLDLSLQLKLYASRINYIDKIDVINNALFAYSYYLPTQEKCGRKVIDKDIIEINEYAQSSFLNMKNMLENIDQNLPLSEAHFEMAENKSKCLNCVFNEICN